jgi:hypothetical protein
MVPSTNTKRVSTGRTPKGRLRHENSQIQFEAIISSPSNPNNQESQILTERQQEVYERQMRSSNVYVDMHSMSPRPGHIALARSPLEFHSDAMSADGIPTEASRTPLKNVRALGEMEVFVGSSPTPQARTRSQEAVSDRTGVATPTVARTVQSTHDNEELGSSPPRFEKEIQPKVHGTTHGAGPESFHADQDEGGRYEGSSLSFDDGMTIDENDFLTGTPDEDPDQGEGEHTTEMEASDVPSSTLDLQLTAQLDAEIQAQKDAAMIKTPSQQPPRKDELMGLPVTNSVQSNTDTTSTSRVGDSFSSLAAESESSQVRSLRRSQRHPSVSSPQSANAKKRKSSSGRGPGRPKKNKTEETDEIGVAITPQGEAVSGHRPALSLTPTGNTVIVPDTTRAQSARRSASLLSRVESQPEDVVMEDTPAPKRARRSIDKDVSEAKQSTPTTAQQLRSKRSSPMVRIAPRGSDGSCSIRGSTAMVGDVDMLQPTREASASLETPFEVGRQNAHVAPQVDDATRAASRMQESQAQLASHSVATPSRSFAERVILTPRSIIHKLKAFKDALFGAPQLVLNRQEHREVDDLMFDIRRAVHAAGVRGEEPSR